MREHPDGAEARLYYYPHQNGPRGSHGRLFEIRDADEVATPGSGSRSTFAYSANNRDVTATRYLPENQTMVTLIERGYLASVTVKGQVIAPAIVQKTTVNGVLVSESFRSLDSRYGGSRSFGRETFTSAPFDASGAYFATSTDADGSRSRSFYRDGLLRATVTFARDSALPSTEPADVQALVAGAGTSGFIAGSSYQYDGFGRVTSSTDARTGTSTVVGRHPSGRVYAITGADGRSVSWTFDELGRTTAVDAPDTLDASGQLLANITRTSYTPRGQVKAVWGDQTYPRAYQYDALGRLSHLHTWKSQPTGEPSLPGEAVTEWRFDPQRGWLTEKNYAGEFGNGPSQVADYTYTAAGRLLSRTWERGVRTDYRYDQGVLNEISYHNESNGYATPSIAYQYDNFGRLTEVTRAGQPHASYRYRSDNLLLEQEILNQDLADSQTLQRSYDSLLRPQGVSIAGSDHAVTYGFDTYGRLGSVQSPGAGTFSYHYQTGSGYLLKDVQGPVHTVLNEWEPHRNVLLTKNNQRPGQTGIGGGFSSYQYLVNAIGQRTQVHVSLPSIPGETSSSAPQFYHYGYNARGEVVGSRVEDQDGRNKQHHRYQYDAIGNRIKTAEARGGNVALPAFPSSATYLTNAQNQYLRVPGATPSSASVTPGYDADGNATSYPLPVAAGSNASLTWDGENRLVKVVKANGEVIDYAYDYLSRRVEKTTAAKGTQSTLYDGWNPIRDEKQDQSGQGFIRYYTWGQDLSGTMQGAGGVGGLLAVTDSYSPSQEQAYYPTYDGNGNVSEYLDATGTITAHFRYDAFGNLTHDGDTAGKFDIRFSTKKQDQETGLYYYGYRFYDPVTGRWIKRDPIAEEGGYNLYSITGNAAVSYWDFLGLIKCKDKGVKELLDNLRSTEVGKNLIEEIEALEVANETEVSVESVAGDSFYKPDAKAVEVGDSIQGYASNTYRGEGSIGTGDNIQATQLEKLTHELTHARDHLKLGDSGYGELGARKDVRYKNGKEKSAIEKTNELREELGRPPRTSYKNPFGRRKPLTPDECECKK